MQVRVLPKKILGVSELGTPKLKKYKSGNRYQRTIRIINDDGVQIQFQFETSANDFNRGIKTATKENLLDATRTLFDEAGFHINIYDAYDFANEFGYPSNTKAERETVRKVWKGLENQHIKANKLGFTDNQIFEVLNYMSKQYEM